VGYRQGGCATISAGSDVSASTAGEAVDQEVLSAPRELYAFEGEATIRETLHWQLK